MALTVNTLNLMVSAEPLNPPVQIPVSGGQFQFYLEVTNTHTQGINTDIWSSVVVADTAEHFKGFTFENFYLGPEASLDTTITVIAHPGLIPGNYTYKVNTGSKIPRYVCASDSFPITVVGDELSGGGMEGALLAFKIGKPHPNPFNEVTSVEFTLDQVMPVSVKVYNLLGQQIAVVLDDVLAPGAYNYKWNAEGFSSGIYYMCLRAGEVSRNYKVLLMK
jgi:hypothetical protein